MSRPVIIRGAGPRVLVIYKKSALQVYVHERKNPRIQQLMTSKHPVVSRLVRAHDSHASALLVAQKVMRKLGAHAEFRFRSDAGKSDTFDLVVTLGGDGTLLWASHIVGPNHPIVAINTAPKDSVGFFCAGTRNELADILESAMKGKLRATKLSRMQVDVDGLTMSKRVLNDALFCHESPASTSRYLISAGGKKEEHKSSGLWVGPAAGSTAALKSAGGRVLPASSKQIQFVAREPYVPPGGSYSLTRGLIPEGKALSVVSKMRAGRLYLDGSHLAHVIEMGSTLRFSRSDEPLTLLGFRR
ncbi:MAG: NAD(+)/NADH kinase [Sandaracinaceae bacterium]|jgi:NAD+ kinase|nr:NAD(+)/NADH kinase [Sandaracinaceae bacterium]